MEGFSGAVRISNISDYIAPSQACVIPLKTNTKEEQEALVAVHSKTAEQRNKNQKVGVKVTISLSDCLACSGCITSAETILVEEQGIQVALQALVPKEEENTLRVVSISSASLASVAVARKVSLAEAANILNHFFINKGADLVIDTLIGEQISLLETWREVAERLESNEKLGPLLVSACPGFVCYAEKSHQGLLLPLLSKAKSCQSCLGVVVKDRLPRLLTPPPSEVYHLSVMPCFDRKLEAAREDNSAPNKRYVDCVVSTAEVNSVLDDYLEEVKDKPGSLQCTLSNLPTDYTYFSSGDLKAVPGNVSGGYLEFVERKWEDWIQQKSQKDGSDNGIGQSSFEKDQKRKMAHLDEITIRHEQSGRQLRMARLYGFRNIQNLVRKLKTKKPIEYDVVEVMACPSGCANGGGQIRAARSVERDSLAAEIERLHEELPKTAVASREWLLGNEVDESRLRAVFKGVDEGQLAGGLSW